MNQYMTSSRVGFVLFFLANLACGENNPASSSPVRWVTQQSGTVQPLNSVAFVNAQVGYAVGQNGTILHTIDGGRTWTAQASGWDYDLTAISLWDEQTGYIVGNEYVTNAFVGIILKTTDGGGSWQTQASNVAPSADFAGSPVAIQCVDATTVVAVGDCVDLGPCSPVIVRTTDGGTHWTTQHVPMLYVLSAVSFPTVSMGYAIGGGQGGGTLLKTTDGGGTWVLHTTGIQGGRSLVFPEPTTGYTLGAEGTILKTTDGGTTWGRQYTGTTQALHAVYFLDSQLGYAVGDRGTVLHTRDGGTTWKAQASGTTQTLRSVSFPDSRTGYAVGDGGTIIKTTP